MSEDLIDEYVSLIEPILPLAKRAYGLRDQKTPAHEASREYTRLLIEFQNKGGSLPMLAKRLKVAYAGVRRRVVMNDISVTTERPMSRVPKAEQNIEASAERVKNAKQLGVSAYHNQLAAEYRAGISLSNLAKQMGLSSAAPLYYGVQRSVQRNRSVS